MLYHEAQVAALCGVHCLNTLLQGPLTDEVGLSKIALEFDAQENAMMREGGVDSAEYLKYLAEGSGNVAENGMFSSQVLSQALVQWSLRVIPLDNPEVRAAVKAPQLEQAFICNLQEHWFTIRKIGPDWWNFNSMFPAPQPLSQFYLEAFLHSLRDQGYTIFVVRGTLPPIAAQHSNRGHGRWFTEEQAKLANDDATAVRARGKTTNAVETAFSRAAQQGGQMQLRSAKRPALSDHSGGGHGGSGSGGGGDDEDPELAAAIAASLGGGAGTSGKPAAAGRSPAPTSSRGGGAAPHSRAAGFNAAAHAAAMAATASSRPPAGAGAGGGGGAHGGHGGGGGGFEDMDQLEDEDPELAAAIAASMADAPAVAASMAASARAPAAARPSPARAPAEVAEPQPEAGPGVVELGFRLPGGARAMQRFAADAPLSSLYRYLRVEHGLRNHVATTQFPRKELADCSTTLAQAGVQARETLNVEQKR